MKTLNIGTDITFNLDCISRTFGILAVRGAGKSNCAAVMAEEMFANQLPFVVIDPVGSWYGLRSSADGNGAGLAIPIFGGKHADVPIDRNSGVLLADLVCSKRLTCVIDLSMFESEADKKHFLTSFARELYRKNEDPLHLFLEEADDYIPQKPMRDEPQLLRAWENIVRRGRSRGLGMTLITQRSAVVNKDVLTQVETLIVLRTTGPQDIAAIREWVKYHQVGAEVISSLSSLADGTAWVWSPDYLKLMKLVHIRRRATFDSGATPKNIAGSTAKPIATLADVNIAEIQQQMAATLQKLKEDDPRELRKQIATLQRERDQALKQKNETKIERVEVSCLTDADRYQLRENVALMNSVVERMNSTHALINNALLRRTAEKPVTHYMTAEQIREIEAHGPIAGQTFTRDSTIEIDELNFSGLTKSLDQMIASNKERDGGLRRIMIAAAQYANNPRTVKQLAHLAGISPKSSTMRGHLAKLRREGWIKESGGTISLTVDGVTALGHYSTLPEGPELREYWIGKLGQSVAAKALAVICAAYPSAIYRTELASTLKINPGSSTLRGALAALRKLCLIEGSSSIYASHTLFDDPER